MSEPYKHVGFKVTAELHKKLKLMSIDTGKSITDILVPSLKNIITEWEKGSINNEDKKD